MDGCGVACWHPKGLRKFANTQWFMIVFGLLGTIQMTSIVFFIITTTTLEKRFKIPSQVTGIILSGNEISQILLSLILTYFGGQRNRPRWIAWGVVFSALSCFILAWPHFIYGAGEEAYQLTEEYLSNHGNISSTILSKPTNVKNNKLCHSSAAKTPEDECEEVSSYVPLVLIFLSQFVLGIGKTLYDSLGRSYLDDNTKQRSSPLQLAYAFSMQMFGPVVGFGLSYLIMGIYIDPSLTPVIKRNDPRWLGAWWLGWVVLGTLMFIFSGLIGMFPKQLPKEVVPSVEYEIDGKKCTPKLEIGEKEETTENEDVKWKNFPRALMRLLTNKLLIFNNLSTVFYTLGGSGFMTFLGRMMEVQFKTSSASGSVFTGPITMFGMTMGLLLSGYVITKYKPSPRYLFFWNVCVGLVSMFAAIGYSQLGCEGNSSLMLNESMASCNSNCACDGITYSPVCDRDTKITYFSPCHAGCLAFNDKENIYTNCSCSARSMSHKRSKFDFYAESTSDTILKAVGGSETNEQLKTLYNGQGDRNHGHFNIERNIYPGVCTGDCKFAYYTFSLLSMISGTIGATGRIGNILLNFRAVEPRDKAFAQGLELFFVSLFALIPGPIIFGRIIDRTCLVWNYKCGRQGNCQLYDPVKFRHYLHSLSALFMFLGVVFDFLVWCYGSTLELYGNDEKPKDIDKSIDKDSGDSPECEPLNKKTASNLNRT